MGKAGNLQEVEACRGGVQGAKGDAPPSASSQKCPLCLLTQQRGPHLGAFTGVYLRVTFVQFWSLIEEMVKQARAQTSNDAAVFSSFGLNLHPSAARWGTAGLDKSCDPLKPLSQVVPCGVSEP